VLAADLGRFSTQCKDAGMPAIVAMPAAGN
jgi:hypothetical protein